MTYSSDGSSSMGTIAASSLIDVDIHGLTFPPCSDDDALDNKCQDNNSTDKSNFIHHTTDIANDFASKSSTAFEILARIKRERMTAANGLRSNEHKRKIEITNLSDRQLFDKKLVNEKIMGQSDDKINTKRDSITEFEQEILDLMKSDDSYKSDDTENQQKKKNQMDSDNSKGAQEPILSNSNCVADNDNKYHGELKEKDLSQARHHNKKRSREQLGKLSANVEKDKNKLDLTMKILAKRVCLEAGTPESIEMEKDNSKRPYSQLQNGSISNVNTFQDDGKLPSKDLTKAKSRNLKIISLDSSESESSIENHTNKPRIRKKSNDDTITTLFEEKKTNGKDLKTFNSPSSERKKNDINIAKDTLQNDLSFLPEPVVNYLFSEQISTCEQLIHYEEHDLAHKFRKHEIFRVTEKLINNLMVDDLWLATKFVKHWKEMARRNISSHNNINQRSKNHDRKDVKIEHCVSSFGAKFLKRSFGITTVSALLDSDPKEIAQKLTNEVEIDSSYFTDKDIKFSFCYGMVNAWFDVAMNKRITVNSSDSQNNQVSPAKKLPLILSCVSQPALREKSILIHHKSNSESDASNSILSSSPRATINNSSVSLHESLSSQHPTNDKAHSTEHIPNSSTPQTLQYLQKPLVVSLATPLHHSSSRNENLSSDQNQDNIKNQCSKKYSLNQEILARHYYTYENKFSSNECRDHENDKSSAKNDLTYLHSDYPRSYENSTHQQHNTPSQSFSTDPIRNSETVLKNDRDKTTNGTDVSNESQKIISNFRRESSKLLGEVKANSMSVQSKKKSFSESMNQQPVTKEWIYPMNNEEVSFLLMKGINTNKKLAKVNPRLLAFHFDKFRSLKGAEQKEKSISIVMCWIRSAQESSSEGKSFPIAYTGKTVGTKKSKTKNFYADSRIGHLSHVHSNTCDTLRPDELITSDSRTPSLTLLDNIKSLCHLAIEEKTGLPCKFITSYDCINDIIYEFLIKIRESSIPGAGYGAFLTYLGAKVLNPRCQKKPKNGELAKTRRTLDAIMPEGKSGVHVTIHGKDIHCDRKDVMGPDYGIGLWKEHSPNDFIPHPQKSFCSFDQGSGLVEIGRYGPLLSNDRKTDLEFVIKDFIFSLEPSSWRFDVPENLRGYPQVIDFTSDVTGEPHDEACRNIAMYVNEVGHNEEAIENVVSRDNTRTVSYYLLQEKPLEQGTTIELLTDYKSWYENVRERKGYGKANIHDGVKSDKDFIMRIARNIRERYQMDATLRSYNEEEISNILGFIKSNILTGIVKATRTHKMKSSGTREKRIILRQWIARRRLHWISIYLKYQLEQILSRHGGIQSLLTENLDSNLGDPTAFPFTPGMLVYVNGWAADSRANYFGIATVEKIVKKSEHIRCYSLSLDRGRYIHDVPEGVLTHPTKAELSQTTKRSMAAWERIKEQSKRPRRTRENVKILDDMQWESELTIKIFDEQKSLDTEEIYDVIMEEISEEILFRLHKERKLTNIFDPGHWCALSTVLLRQGLRVLIPCFMETLGRDSKDIHRELLKLAHGATKFIRSLANSSSQVDNQTDCIHDHFSKLKVCGLEALSFTSDEFLENNANQHNAKKSILNDKDGDGIIDDTDTKLETEKPAKLMSKASSESFVVVKDGTHSPLKDRAKLMGGGKKLLRAVNDGEVIHSDWYIVHQVISTVHELALILPFSNDNDWTYRKLCEELGINPNVAAVSYAAARRSK